MNCLSIRFQLIPSFAARFAVCFLVLFFAAFSQAMAAGTAPRGFSVGMRTFGVWDAAAQERFDFAVWYPGSFSDAEVVREGWVIEAGRRSRIAPGFYPVVLLSHDSASGRFANNDLAAALAASGMIVIAPTHTGDNQNNSDMLYTADLLYERPRQMLRALETVLDSPDFAPYADESRIGLVGVGFGSISALQLAGAQPDFTGLEEYCSRATEPDPFCSPWAAKRLFHMPEAMRKFEKAKGANAFRPSLALFAPKLVPAPIPVAVPEVAETKKKEPEGKGKPSFFKRLFSKSEEESEEPQMKTDDAASGPDTAPGAVNGTSGAGVSLLLDFQGGPLFGGTDSGDPFVHIATSDSPQFRIAVAEDSSASLASPVPAPARVSALQAHRRPPENRHIRGIALMAPAGGMLFSKKALENVQVPVALVEAEQDMLYPPRQHAQPYFARFPVRPEVLQLKNVDHFSLFARCAKDTMADLGEVCGRLVGGEREKIAEQRDAFLIAFFQSVLGEALPPAAPSGFVAAPPAVEPLPGTNSTLKNAAPGHSEPPVPAGRAARGANSRHSTTPPPAAAPAAR